MFPRQSLNLFRYGKITTARSLFPPIKFDVGPGKFINPPCGFQQVPVARFEGKRLGDMMVFSIAQPFEKKVRRVGCHHKGQGGDVESLK